MTQGRALIKRLSADLFVFSVFHCGLAVLLCTVAESLRAAWLSTLLVLPFLAVAALRRRMGNLGLFLLAHLALAACPLPFGRDSTEQALLVLFTSSLAIYSFRVRLKPETGALETSLLCFGVGIAMSLSLLAGYLEAPGIRPMLAMWSVVMLLCNLLYTHISRMEALLLVAASRRPARSILRFNNLLIAGFLLLSGGAAALSTLFSLEGIGRGIKSALLAFLRWLGGLLPAIEEVAEERIEELPSSGMEFGALEAAEPNRLLALLEQILYVVFQLALALGAAYLLAYGAYRLYKRFYSPPEDDGDIREYIGPRGQTESLKNALRSLRGRTPSFGRDEREAVRRRYYRKIRGHIRKGTRVVPPDTSREIAGRIRPAEDIDELTARYERARYGP